jgi:hypothetical protein
VGWHPDPEDKAAWSTAGGAVMAAGAGGAIGWLAIAEPSSSHEPLWPVFAFGVVAVVGLYGMLAPLLSCWPWRSPAKARKLTLAIDSLDLSGLGEANLPRLQLWVKATSLGAPTILHDWQLQVRLGEHTQAAEHLAGSGQQPNRVEMSALDEMTGTTPFQGQATGLVYFVLPNVSRLSFRLRLLQAILLLSVKDQDGGEWHTERRVDEMGPSEEYDPKASEPGLGRVGYRGRPGSRGDLSKAKFGKGLDTAIDNEGDVDASEADIN